MSFLFKVLVWQHVRRIYSRLVKVHYRPNPKDEPYGRKLRGMDDLILILSIYIDYAKENNFDFLFSFGSFLGSNNTLINQGITRLIIKLYHVVLHSRRHTESKP